MVKKYNKLIRDKIPEIMEGKGVSSEHHIADDVEFEQKLHAKLLEEVEEFLEDESIEEMADIMEVIYAIAELHNFDLKDVEKIRIKKKEERGGFEKKIILDSTS